MSFVDGIGQKAAQELVAIAKRLESMAYLTQHSWSVDFSDLSTDAINNLKCDFEEKLTKDCLSIYTFHLSGTVCVETLATQINLARANNGENRAYPRVNKNQTADSYRCLYVGSSRTTPKRLKEHLGFGNLRTYSLQLAYWASNLPGQFTIDVVEFSNNKESQELIPFLEDRIAQDRKPILGRRGMR
jgi:hypothetical protein